MKIEISPEQEDEIYYGRIKEVVAMIESNELDFDTPEEKAEALKAFETVRNL